MDAARVSSELPDFEGLLRATAAEIDPLLDRLLPRQESDLITAMRYALLGGGKRLRPFLVVESAQLFAVARQSALRAAAALECIHCYSLIHDDLPAMDNDDLRRGKPTVHRAFDEATAILAGDALHTLAFEILSHPETHPDAGVRVELIASLARAAGSQGMAGGQMLDLSAQRSGGRELSWIMRMQAMKTGALFSCACESGAILGRASARARLALGSYSDTVGLAFQIADDILDVESSSDRLGKATQKDVHAGKVTYVDLLGLAGARAAAAELVSKAKQALAPFGERAKTLAEAADFIIQRTS